MKGMEKEYYGALYAVAKAVGSSLDFDQVLDAIVKATAEAMGVRACLVRLLGRRGQRLLVTCAHGLSEAYLRKGVVEVSKSVIDQDVLAGKSVMIVDVSSDPRFQYPAEAKQEGLVSLLAVPLLVKGEVIGVMRVYSGQPRTFTKDEAAFLSAVADLSALAIENARLHQALRADYDTLAAYENRLFD